MIRLPYQIIKNVSWPINHQSSHNNLLCFFSPHDALPTADALLTVPATCELPIPPLGNIHISHSEVFRQLSNLNEIKSPGTDGLTPTLLKKSTEVVSTVLHFTMLSLSRGILPTSLKHTPILSVFMKAPGPQLFD